MQSVQNFIDGQWREPTGQERWTILDPSTTAELATARASTSADVDAAVKAAKAALPAWAARTPGDRAALLNLLADALTGDAEFIVGAEVANAGKPVAAFRDGEWPDILDSSRYFASLARSMSAPASGEYIARRTSLSRREPVGVVAAITPWNFPLLQVILKIVPALAVGNTVVVKPAELTPLTACRLVELAAEILPPGVLNLVHGPGNPTGTALVSHRDVALVSFTGSVAAGKSIARAAADGLTRLVLELGGNAPALVFDDAPIDDAVAALVDCAIGNAGQDCTASSRVLVHRSVYDAVVEQIVAKIAEVRIGATTDETTQLGPLISASQRQRVEKLIDGRSSTSELLTGGKRPDLPGYYLHPTVITNVQQTEPLVQNEIFGPVMTIQRFDSDEEGLALANGTSYGLAASVWTESLTRAHRLSNALNAGTVWINDHTLFSPDVPQGGYGDSGYGKENGLIGVEELTRLKQVSINLTERP